MSGELSSSSVVTGPSGTAATLFLEDDDAWVVGLVVPLIGPTAKSSARTTHSRRFGSVGAAALVQGH